MAVRKIVDLTLAAVTANNLNCFVLRSSLVNPAFVYTHYIYTKFDVDSFVKLLYSKEKKLKCLLVLTSR